MIIAYVQSEHRQGVDAARDGQSVDPEEKDFAAIREKAAALNFSASPRNLGDVEVRYGKNLVRLELSDTSTGSTNLSPIIVVASIHDIARNFERALNSAIDSVAAIDRTIDPELIASGFKEGQRLHESFRKRRYFAAALAIALAACTAIWISRGAPGPWNR